MVNVSLNLPVAFLFHTRGQELLMEILSVLLLDRVANGLFMVKKAILEEKVVV